VRKSIWLRNTLRASVVIGTVLGAMLVTTSPANAWRDQSGLCRPGTLQPLITAYYMGWNFKSTEYEDTNGPRSCGWNSSQLRETGMKCYGDAYGESRMNIVSSNLTEAFDRRAYTLPCNGSKYIVPKSGWSGMPGTIHHTHWHLNGANITSGFFSETV
jgi:hypothetical protein